MENIKKNPLSLQLNAEDFLPASNEEKAESGGHARERQLLEGRYPPPEEEQDRHGQLCVHHCHCHLCLPSARRVALQLLGAGEGQQYLAPFEYSASEQARIDAGERCSRTFWVPTVWAVTLRCVS